MTNSDIVCFRCFFFLFYTQKDYFETSFVKLYKVLLKCVNPIFCPNKDCSFEFDRPINVRYLTIQSTFFMLVCRMSSNCLITTSAVNQTHVNININTPPGQFINIDQQCQHLYGVNSYYCGVCYMKNLINFSCSEMHLVFIVH